MTAVDRRTIPDSSPAGFGNLRTSLVGIRFRPSLLSVLRAQREVRQRVAKDCTPNGTYYKTVRDNWKFLKKQVQSLLDGREIV